MVWYSSALVRFFAFLFLFHNKWIKVPFLWETKHYYCCIPASLWAHGPWQFQTWPWLEHIWLRDLDLESPPQSLVEHWTRQLDRSRLERKVNAVEWSSGFKFLFFYYYYYFFYKNVLFKIIHSIDTGRLYCITDYLKRCISEGPWSEPTSWGSLDSTITVDTKLSCDSWTK